MREHPFRLLAFVSFALIVAISAIVIAVAISPAVRGQDFQDLMKLLVWPVGGALAVIVLARISSIGMEGN